MFGPFFVLFTRIFYARLSVSSSNVLPFDQNLVRNPKVSRPMEFLFLIRYTAAACRFQKFSAILSL
jgi:hypothetical protein